jgi:hypothetical protein
MNGRAMVMAYLATALGWAGDRTVTICFKTNPEVDYKIQALAQGYATRIYGSIGIELHWKVTCSQAEWNAPGTDAAPNLASIGIAWVPKAPQTIPLGARASARPFQATGDRVSLYLDRIIPVLEQREPAAAILGHILAHEIGHVLLGHDAHATHGLMKGIWNDVEQTLYRPMQFTAEDAAQIHRRLRGSLALSAANR